MATGTIRNEQVDLTKIFIPRPTFPRRSYSFANAQPCEALGVPASTIIRLQALVHSNARLDEGAVHKVWFTS